MSLREEPEDEPEGVGRRGAAGDEPEGDQQEKNLRGVVGEEPEEQSDLTLNH